ncbi:MULTISPECIES: glycoside hydrolase family 31 protein [Flavobacteriaceae]|uniref:glycoside hydrolase family 31 protein n=1 Tax=Flavobacteriaceae TaxID=49546 RepID=UPI0014909EF6|nr:MULTISPECIES: TIM-barrel domain-containing protein [Allomuricauda]MDC6367628.1 glycoside hydrolase family 31 protein [Muricauda sp. AC10]
MKKLVCLLFLFTFKLLLSQQSLGDFKNIKQIEDNELLIETTSGKVLLELCTSKALRFRASWGAEFLPEEDYMVVNYNWPKVDFEKTENLDKIRLKTSQLTVVLNKTPFTIAIEGSDGKVLSEEITGSFKNNKTVGSVKKLFPGEHFFGLGERMDGLDCRGKKTRLNVGRGQGLPHIVGAYNILEANYSPIPFFMSTRGYGVFYHTAHPTNWDMGHSSNNQYTFDAEGGELDYYFIYGPSFTDIIDGYTNLTGKSPLLPKFAHGLHVGTYSGGTWGHEEETSDQYVVNLAKKFRKMKIPVDVLHLDSTWRIFGENGGKGATSFEWRQTFGDPKAMFDSLYALNFNMVGLHLRPRFDNGKTMRLLDKARELNYVYPESNGKGEFVNFFDDASVDWWWNNGVKKVADQGAMFLKTDEGSAFGHKANESDKTGPQGEDIIPMHNLFPLAYAKAPYLKFSEYNQMRGLNLTREGYAGIQRYPYIFAGDWPSEWQYFEPVILAGINIGLSGVGYWGHCMGGFEHVADPELYMRWVQFGMLSPVAHLFGMEHPNYKEPWSYGDEALSNFVKYDELRYRLLPYIYSSAYQQYKLGKPLMRALVMDNEEDQNAYNITDQYMFGDNLMVCPVTTKGAKTRVVYLPKGKWVDFWNGKQYDGQQFISVLCPADIMPIFVKVGAIIPTQRVVQYVDKSVVNHINLNIYDGGDGNFELYDDDGISNQYATKEVYAITQITTKLDGENIIEVNIDKPKGSFKIGNRSYTVEMQLTIPPNEVYLNGKPLNESKKSYENSSGYKYMDGRLFVYVPDATSKDTKLRIVKF